MPRLSRTTLLATTALAGAITFSGMAVAQVDEVIVTAQKRAQSLQDVPIAVTAVSGEDLRLSGIQDLIDLQYSAPSLFINNTNDPSTSATIRIRGVGTTGNNAGLEGAVGFFLDGVYRSRAGVALSDMIDVERVEVLRGPQGTLFGKNTSAGAISVITKKPSNEFEAFAQVDIGNYNLRRVRGSVNIPAGDNAAFRISGGTNQRDGFIENIGDSRTFNDKDRYNVKGQALFTPTDNLEIRLIADYAKAEEHCCQSVRVFNGPTAPLVIPLAVANGYAGPNPALATSYTNSINGPVEYGFEDWGVSGEVNWDLGFAVLTSITAYRNFESDNLNDVDFTGADILDQLTLFENTQFTEEVRLAGRIEDFASGFDWMLGAFYSDEEFGRTANLIFGADVTSYATSLGLPGAVYPQGSGNLQRFDQEGNSWSIFAHGALDVTEQFTLTGGLRFNNEEKDAMGTIITTHFAVGGSLGALPFISPTNNYVASFSEEEVTGTVKAQYRFTDDFMSYASYSRGYKTGGINLDRSAGGLQFGTLIPPGLAPLASCLNDSSVPQPAGPQSGVLSGIPIFPCTPSDPTFEGEFADNYELGVRTTWFDGILTLNVTGFFTEFENFQLNTFDGLNFTIINVPGAETMGVEAEYTLNATENLTFSGGVNWVEARYLDSVGPPSPTDPPLGGKALTNAPQVTASTSIHYERPISDTVVGYARAEVFHTTKRDTGSDLDPVKRVGGYTLLNGRLGAKTENGFELSVWCRNCLDERFNTVIFDSVGQAGSYDAFIGNPMEVGVSASIKY